MHPPAASQDLQISSHEVAVSVRDFVRFENGVFVIVGHYLVFVDVVVVNCCCCYPLFSACAFISEHFER